MEYPIIKDFIVKTEKVELQKMVETCHLSKKEH